MTTLKIKLAAITYQNVVLTVIAILLSLNLLKEPTNRLSESPFRLVNQQTLDVRIVAVGYAPTNDAIPVRIQGEPIEVKLRE